MTNQMISIIMPAYNAEKNINEAVESVINQTYTNWELIIVDDFSKDQTGRIVKQLTKLDSRIKYYKNKKNKKVAKTRNEAFKHVSGRYLAFLDSDDKWLPHKLETQLSKMKEKESAFVFSSYYIMDENSNYLNKKMMAPEVVRKKDILKGSKIGCLTVLLDLTKVKYPGMKDIGHEDYLTWIEVLQQTEQAHGILEPLAFYRISGTSLSGNKFKSAHWQYNIYRNHLGLSYLQSLYYFVHYSFNGIFKYRKEK